MFASRVTFPPLILSWSVTVSDLQRLSVQMFTRQSLQSVFYHEPYNFEPQSEYNHLCFASTISAPINLSQFLLDFQHGHCYYVPRIAWAWWLHLFAYL